MLTEKDFRRITGDQKTPSGEVAKELHFIDDLSRLILHSAKKLNKSERKEKVPIK